MEKGSSLQRQSDKTALADSIRACIANGERLLDDAMQVEFQDPPSTKLILSMIAQEEFAKAFLLFLVAEDIVPWSPHLLRATRDHACKQLVGVMIDYLEPEWETLEELRGIIGRELDLGNRLPPKVSSAVNILRHEKIGRWESNTWEWAEDPEYEPSVLGIARGNRDRIKQDALYVGLGRDGRVKSVPTGVNAEAAKDEFAVASRYRGVIQSLMNGDRGSIHYNKMRGALRAVFNTDGHSAEAREDED